MYVMRANDRLPFQYVLEMWLGIFALVVLAPLGLMSAVLDLLAARDERIRTERGIADLALFFHDIPTAEELSEQWIRSKRSLVEKIRFGSMLLRIETYCDNSVVTRYIPELGREAIVAREPGVKGALRACCPEIVYKTAMSYKNLATRLRQVLGMPPFMPPEWALLDQRHLDGERGEGYDPEIIRKARNKLEKLLKLHGNAHRLLAEMDRILGRVVKPLKNPRKPINKHARQRLELRAGRRQLRMTRDKYAPEMLEWLSRRYGKLAEEVRQARSAAGPATA